MRTRIVGPNPLLTEERMEESRRDRSPAPDGTQPRTIPPTHRVGGFLSSAMRQHCTNTDALLRHPGTKTVCTILCVIPLLVLVVIFLLDSRYSSWSEIATIISLMVSYVPVMAMCLFFIYGGHCSCHREDPELQSTIHYEEGLRSTANHGVWPRNTRRKPSRKSPNGWRHDRCDGNHEREPPPDSASSVVYIQYPSDDSLSSSSGVSSISSIGIGDLSDPGDTDPFRPAIGASSKKHKKALLKTLQQYSPIASSRPLKVLRHETIL